MKKISIFISTLLFIFFSPFLMPKKVLADTVTNNKVGIHLAVPENGDIKDAAKLVNSAGGDWGYVTLVIQEDDRNQQKWQEIFDQLRELHLIPIIRLATKPEGAMWKRPTKNDAGDWVNFLDSLNWVIKKRYVILFNEPNHGSEWGGNVDAYNYAETTKEFAKKLKEKNKDFFVMMAGFDASAPNIDPDYADEYYFLKNIFEKIPPQEFGELFDGWVSHSYPNPAFSGSPYESGRITIRGYQWELDVLREFGLTKDLPVFITETGWSSSNLSRQTIADYTKYALESIWLSDDRVEAITPFILNYQGEPFLNFSWKLPTAEASEDHNFYPQYYTIQSLTKVKGDPEIVEKGELSFNFPKELVAYSNYDFKLKVKNMGQGIWDKKDGYKLEIENGVKKFENFFSDLKSIKPKEEADIDFYIKTNGNFGESGVKIVLTKNGKKVAEAPAWKFKVNPLPSLVFRVGLLPKIKSSGNDFEIQIFDKKERLVFSKNNLVVKDAQGILTDIQNVALDEKYRIVILKPYYLPRQEYVTFGKDGNTVRFKSMLPLDLNADGKYNFFEVFKILKNPSLIKLFIP